jgi:hypothetical protein
MGRHVGQPERSRIMNEHAKDATTAADGLPHVVSTQPRHA